MILYSQQAHLALESILCKLMKDYYFGREQSMELQAVTALKG